MKYLQPSFSVSAPGTRQYRDNWDAIFGKKKPCAECNGFGGIIDIASGALNYEVERKCTVCDGTGKAPA